MNHIAPKVFLIDFDGTSVLHNFPEVGPDVPGAVEVMKKLQDAGHTLVLHTMRADHLLDDAQAWFHERCIEIKYVNCNPEFETGSRKIYGISIDDHNIGVPLKFDDEIHHKPFVDWEAVEKILAEKGYL